MALEWDDKPGLVGYLEDREISRKRAMEGPRRCSCERGPLVNTLEDDSTCVRCGKPTVAFGRAVRAAA